MLDPAERARIIAERLKSARDARGATASDPPSQAPEETFRAPFWTVWPETGDAVRVLFSPELSRAEVREHFYPAARSILNPSEVFEVPVTVDVPAAGSHDKGKRRATAKR